MHVHPVHILSTHACVFVCVCVFHKHFLDVVAIATAQTLWLELSLVFFFYKDWLDAARGFDLIGTGQRQRHTPALLYAYAYFAARPLFDIFLYKEFPRPAFQICNSAAQWTLREDALLDG